jgi:hypothetical protein
MTPGYDPQAAANVTHAEGPTCLQVLYFSKGHRNPVQEKVHSQW